MSSTAQWVRTVSSIMELLEPRALCDATVAATGGSVSAQSSPPPRITDLFVAGSAWTLPFKQHLEANFLSSSADFGYGVPGPSGTAQVPWVNLDRVSLHFTAEMQVDVEDLRVFGVNVREYPVASIRFELDAGGYQGTATWTLGRPLVNDKVLIVVDGSDSGPRATWGGLMDGDNDNRPGGDYRWRLDVLPGDGGRNGVVDRRDLMALRTSLFTTVSNPGVPGHYYSAFDDIDGDGRISAFDFADVRRRLGTRLPLGEPAAPPSAALAASVRTSALFSSQPILPP